MKKALKRIAAVCAVLVVIALAAGWYLRRQALAVPEFYKPIQSEEQRRAAGDAADKKATGLVSRLNEFTTAERRGEPSHAAQVTFTESELDGLLHKWIKLLNREQDMARYAVDPVIRLRDGKIIVAARVPDLDAVISMHFVPRINEAGRAELTLERIWAGEVPIPQALLGRLRQKVNDGILRDLPQWQARAKIAPDGVANQEAIAATTSKMIAAALNERPAEAVAFVPAYGSKYVPVQFTEINVTPEGLTLTVSPMNAAQRAELLTRIKQPVDLK